MNHRISFVDRIDKRNRRDDGMLILFRSAKVTGVGASSDEELRVGSLPPQAPEERGGALLLAGRCVLSVSFAPPAWNELCPMNAS
jgi:hypothetical protein